MTTGHADGASRDQLRDLEDQLAELRRTASELRAQIGDAATGPEDAAERSAMITQAEEQEALVAMLQERRRRLREQLGDSA
jgi:septal ring factor EnvC (AmiA/AmiB activator)